MSDEKKKAKLLRFKLPVKHPWDAFKQFHPDGYQVLNSSAWNGKEPRSCAVTGMSGNSLERDTEGATTMIVEVTYRPKGVITFVGDTKYDGWTAMMLDKQKDGTLLDGHGKPLPDGAPPVYLPFEVYKDVDFNQMDFGEFLDETEIDSVKRVTFKSLMDEMRTTGGSMGASAYGEFMVPRRSRPMVKLVLVDGDMVQATSDSVTKLVMINRFAPHLERQIEDRVYETLASFLEGRAGLATFAFGSYVVADLSGLLLESRRKENGESDTDHEALFKYIKPSFLDELAVKLMAVYEVDVSVVEGEHAGLLFERQSKKPKTFTT